MLFLPSTPNLDFSSNYVHRQENMMSLAQMFRRKEPLLRRKLPLLHPSSGLRMLAHAHHTGSILLTDRCSHMFLTWITLFPPVEYFGIYSAVFVPIKTSSFAKE